MEIENLKARMYFLAGQLEEAKKVYGDALREIDELKKKSDIQETDTASTNGGKTVYSGDGNAA